MTGDSYKAIRLRLGLTQVEMADHLGVTSKTIKMREGGARITKEAEMAIRFLTYSDRPTDKPWKNVTPAVRKM